MSAIIKQAQSEQWEAEKRILKHIDISPAQRFSSLDSNNGSEGIIVSSSYGFSDPETRDKFTAILKNAIGGTPTVSLEVSDERDARFSWPYLAKVIVSGHGIDSLESGYQTLAACFQVAASPFPKENGKDWDEFVKGYSVEDKMVYKGAAENQIAKMTALRTLLGKNVDLTVVGSHRSKSIDLPVIQFEFPDCYTKVTIRDNFYDLCVSVDAKFPIEDKSNFERHFSKTKTDGYFEGFPAGTTFGTYEQNQSQFSCVLAHGDYGGLMVLLNEVDRQDYKYARRPKLEVVPAPAA